MNLNIEDLKFWGPIAVTMGAYIHKIRSHGRRIKALEEAVATGRRRMGTSTGRRKIWWKRICKYLKHGTIGEI